MSGQKKTLMPAVLLEPPIPQKTGALYPWVGLAVGGVLGLLLARPLPLIAQEMLGVICYQQPLRFHQIWGQSFSTGQWPALALYTLGGSALGALLGTMLQHLKQHRQRLQTLNHEFELQVAALRHHYKNLTLGIHGFTSRIKRKLSSLDEEFRQCIKDDCPTYGKFHEDHEALKRNVAILEDTSQRLSQTLSQELQFLRALTSDTSACEPRDFYPFLTASIRDLLGLRFRDRGILVRVNGQSLEECRDSLILCFEPCTMEVILQNLLGNAMKFGDQVDVTVAKGEGTAKVEIRDNGPGFEVEELKRKLTACLEGEKTEASHLGLKVSLHLLTKVGGRLSAWSAPGRGSCFIVEFPG
jgi:signal transduction histidine kinase